MQREPRAPRRRRASGFATAAVAAAVLVVVAALRPFRAGHAQTSLGPQRQGRHEPSPHPGVVGSRPAAGRQTSPSLTARGGSHLGPSQGLQAGPGHQPPCLHAPCPAGQHPLLAASITGLTLGPVLPGLASEQTSVVQLLTLNTSPKPLDTLGPSPAKAATRASTEQSDCAALRASHPPLSEPYMKRLKRSGSKVSLPFTLCASRRPTDPQKEFTLVTHTDLRIPISPETGQLADVPKAGLRELRVLRLAERWEGIISVGARLVWTDANQTTEVTQAIIPNISERLADTRERLESSVKAYLSRLTSDLSAFDVHLVSYGGTYNQNAGRNIALRSARTPFILVTDADFVPPVGIFGILNSKYRPLLCGSTTALVLPHFDVFDASAPDASNEKKRPGVLSGREPPPEYVYAICSGKDSLIEGFKAGNITRFHEYNLPHTWCHHTEHWLKADAPFRIGPDFLNHGCPHLWEPILAFHRNALMPAFPEIFAGRGYDRVSHVLELRWMAYNFLVASELFLCHPAERHKWSKGDSEDEKWNTAYFRKVWKNRMTSQYSSPSHVRSTAAAMADVSLSCSDSETVRLSRAAGLRKEQCRSASPVPGTDEQARAELLQRSWMC